MHFMAMIGFTVAGVPIRYDVPITVASWIIAVVVVGDRPVHRRLRPARARSRSSPAASSPGSASRRCTTPAWPRCGCRRRSTTTATLVVASVAIAVVAATVALWFTVTLRASSAARRRRADHGCRRQRHALHRHVRACGSSEFAAEAGRRASCRWRSSCPIVVFVVAVIVVLLVVAAQPVRRRRRPRTTGAAVGRPVPAARADAHASAAAHGRLGLRHPPPLTASAPSDRPAR